MKSNATDLYKNLLLCLTFIICISFLNAQTVSFSSSNLIGENLHTPTSLQFGPDGRLYVSQQDGKIYAYTIIRNGPNNYQVTHTESIDLIKSIPNHNDNGATTNNMFKRQVTGILVTGTPSNPIIYVSSSDPRIGGGNATNDKNLDTNSGIVSKLTKNGNSWTKVDLVRGLPRSEENHSVNGMQLKNNILYLAVGGHTNMGAPSGNFIFTSEYALSAAILSIDLGAINNPPYDIPTLNNTSTPFGGADGNNQAKLVQGGPVQVYAPGFRNPYDLVITESGKMYAFDNGPNAGWGDKPINCSNSVSEPGITHCDWLHYISGPGYYGGHPNPTRANRNNTFNGKTPIPAGMENPIECSYLAAGSAAGALKSVCSSTNGICEYTATNFNGSMKGNLLAVALNGKLYRYKLNSAGNGIVSGGETVLGQGFGSNPLDVTAQGDGDIFPGSIWLCTYSSGNITILEPNDFVVCTPNVNSYTHDSDGDGYSDADEADNGTNPCSAASKPDDFDGDFISDLNDPDDDNDGILDENDAFALDPANGTATTIPVIYAFDNVDDGGIRGWGFTGLMKNGVDNYQDLFNPLAMTVGGAARKFTVDQVPNGDAYLGNNNQQNGFQFGVNVSSVQDNFVAHTRIINPFAGATPSGHQAMGLFIGTGDQDNYLKIVTTANGGAGGIQVLLEVNGIVPYSETYGSQVLGANFVDLYLDVNPGANTVQASYSLNGGIPSPLGSEISIPAGWLNHVLAVGILSTSNGASPFPATWDFIEVTPNVNGGSNGNWQIVNTNNNPTNRHECSFVETNDKFYLMGGRGSKPVQEFNPASSSWTNKANPPIELHHYQAIEYNGLIYAICAFTGLFPNEIPVENIYIYNPSNNTWSVGPTIPANRRRGSAGVVIHNGEFYIVSGIQNGHIDGWVPWLDKFTPATNTWTILPDAPRARDHFHAALVGNKIYAIAGRRTGQNGTFAPTVPEVDVFNINTGQWSSLPSASNIPTQRAGAAVAVVGNEIIVIGGESNSQPVAHNETEALDVSSNNWRSLDNLNIGRHGTQAIVYNNGIYVCAGSGNMGGSPELNSMEVLNFSGSSAPSVSISSPADGETFIAGGNIPITAVAYDQGTITKVEFFAGSAKLGEATNIPYSIVWSSIPAGNYSLTAVATDNDNLSTTSSPVNISISGSGGGSAAAVIGLTLVNATTNQDITQLNNGEIVNLQELSTTELNIRANTSPPTVGSVKFNLNGNSNYKTESEAPYALGGDSNGDYAPWTFSLTTYTITATPYSGSGGSGTAGTPLSITFEILDQPLVPDCNGIIGGSAFIDDCGICSEGNTNHVANSNMDCAGVCSGTAYLNDCNICVGGSTGLPDEQEKDCLGICFGNANLDCNGICDGPSVTDCEGICGGISIADCNGDCNGIAYVNDCNLCVGGNTGLADDEGKDCLGLCGGSVTIDCNGICGGQAISDCLGICGGTAQLDDCGVCDGDNSSCNCELLVTGFTLTQAGTFNELAPLNNGDVVNKFLLSPFGVKAELCSSPVGSVVFFLNGSKFRIENAAPYCLTGDNSSGFSEWNPSPGNYTIEAIPYSQPYGQGSEGLSKTITVTIIDQDEDCNGDIAGSATVDDCGVCAGGNTGLVPNADKDCNGECDGPAKLDGSGNCCLSGILDCNGVCDGPATTDSSGNCCPSGILDCNGVCDGTAVEDCAGTCGGSAVQDCEGVCNGTATIDCNNICNGPAVTDSSGNCCPSGILDCNGVCDGPATTDGSGNCCPSGIIDCNGVCDGTAVEDCAGVCGGSATEDCAGICNGTSTIDCNGECGGTAVIDSTGSCCPSGILGCDGVCDGPGIPDSAGNCCSSGVLDCFGVCDGAAAEDCAGVCVGSATEDCAGTCNGTSTIDCNGVCGGPAVTDGSGNCCPSGILDCNGVCDGPAIPDGSGNCCPSGVVDCNGVCDGTAVEDCAGTCGGSATQDCAGTCNGTAELDCNGICNGTATLDCNGVCGGPAVMDFSGNCCPSGILDCKGDCDGTALVDDCGVCDGDNTSCNCELLVTGFTLTEAGTFNELNPLNDGDVVNKFVQSPFGVKAELCSSPVGSVVFFLNGSKFRIENVAPYCLTGDNSAGFSQWNPTPGNYTIQAIPYPKLYGQGTKGIGLSIDIQIINSAVKTSGPQEHLSEFQDEVFSDFTIYPNPNSGQFTVELNCCGSEDITIKIFNKLGQLMYMDQWEAVAGDTKRDIDLQDKAAGVYFIHLETSDTRINHKLMIK